MDIMGVLGFPLPPVELADQWISWVFFDFLVAPRNGKLFKFLVFDKLF